MARLTRKDVRRAVIISLSHKIPDDFAIGENCGIYGWNWTAYRIDGRYAIQGYRSFPTDAVSMPKAYVEELDAIYDKNRNGEYVDYDAFMRAYSERFNILYELTVH